MTALRFASINRVSTDELAKGWSVDNQVEFNSSAAKLLGGEVVETILEPGDSGKRVLLRGDKFNPRKGIAQLLKLVDSKQVDAVIAYTQDRYHRNDYEFELLLRQHLWPKGIQVYAGTQLLDDSDPHKWQARKSEGNYAEMHSRITSHKVTRSNDMARARGELTNGRPWPCDQIPKSRQWVWNPERKVLYFELLHRAAAGEPLYRIACDWNDRGIQTRGGGPWRRSTLVSLVGCRWFLGELQHKDKPLLDDSGEPAIFPHDCMVDRALWEAAQQPAKAYMSKGYVYLLNDVLVSSHWRVVHPAKHAGPAKYKGHAGRNPRYCRLDRYMSDFCECVPADDGADYMGAYFDSNELEQAVVQQMIQDAKEDTLLKWVMDEAEASPADGGPSRTDQITAKQAELERVMQRLTAAVDSGASALVPGLNARALDLQGEIDKLHRIRPSRKELPLTLLTGLEQINLIETAWQQGRRAELRRIIASLVEHVDVRVDGINIRYKRLRDPGGEVDSPAHWDVSIASPLRLVQPRGSYSRRRQG